MAETKHTDKIIAEDNKNRPFVLFFGWLVLGLSLGWLARALMISASEGANKLAVGVIIMLNIVAAISAFSIVIRPIILHRLQLKRPTSYTPKLRVVDNATTPPRL